MCKLSRSLWRGSICYWRANTIRMGQQSTMDICFMEGLLIPRLLVPNKSTGSSCVLMQMSNVISSDLGLDTSVCWCQMKAPVHLGLWIMCTKCNIYGWQDKSNTKFCILSSQRENCLLGHWLLVFQYVRLSSSRKCTPSMIWTQPQHGISTCQNQHQAIRYKVPKPVTEKY